MLSRREAASLMGYFGNTTQGTFEKDILSSASMYHKDDIDELKVSIFFSLCTAMQWSVSANSFIYK